MFVRKGTVIRKGRGSGRKSIRRPNRDANGTASPRKVTIHDDPSSTGSGSYRPPPSPEFFSSNSFRMPADDKVSYKQEDECLNLRQIKADDKYSSALEDKYSSVLEDRIYQNHLKPSPARSIGVVSNTIFFTLISFLLRLDIFVQ